MNKRRLIPILIPCLLASCGGAAGFPADIPTESAPVVSSVDPTAGSAGDSITIFGYGFSYTVANNIVIIGGVATTATEYRLLEDVTSTEIEAITTTVPADAAVGESSVAVVVYENTSNTDITFTVTE